MIWGAGASAADSDPVQNPESGTILFQSQWDYATGTGRDAVEDGAFSARKFYRECAATTTVANVIAGSGAGWSLSDNCLEVTKAGTNCTQIWASSTGATNTVPGLADRESHYIRLYIRADLTNEAQDWANHPICSPETADIECRHWSPREVNTGAGTYKARMFMDHPSTADGDDERWSSAVLSLNTWYRFEWFIDFYDVSNPDRYRIYPRIYSLAGALLQDSTDYLRSAETAPHADSLETLQEWYDGGGYFEWASAAISNSFGVGYEGPAGASNTGEKVYMAALAVGTGGWLGGYV